MDMRGRKQLSAQVLRPLSYGMVDGPLAGGGQAVPSRRLRPSVCAAVQFDAERTRFDSNRAVPTRISRNARSTGGVSNGCSENSVERGR
jgi:hypothetical protein